MSRIVEAEDPYKYISQDPHVDGTGQYMWQLRMKCGFVVGGLESVIYAITGFSPLESWVMKPLAGDWAAFDRGGVAWRNSGLAINAIASNIRTLPGQVGSEWEGEAYEEWAVLQTKIVSALDQMPAACGYMAELTEALADYARAIGDLIAASIKVIVDEVLALLATLALNVIPVAGQVATAIRVGLLVVAIGEYAFQIASLIMDFYAAVEKFNAAVPLLAAALTDIRRITDALCQTQATTTSGSPQYVAV